MTKIRNDILLLLAKELRLGDVKLNMAGYVSVRGSENNCVFSPEEYREAIGSCNTACCVMGLVPKVAPKFAAEFLNCVGSYSFVEMGYVIAGQDDKSPIWDFCFSGSWGNDREQAARRIEYVIEHGTCPDDFFVTDTLDLKGLNFGLKL